MRFKHRTGLWKQGPFFYKAGKRISLLVNVFLSVLALLYFSSCKEARLDGDRNLFNVSGFVMELSASWTIVKGLSKDSDSGYIALDEQNHIAYDCPYGDSPMKPVDCAGQRERQKRNKVIRNFSRTRYHFEVRTPQVYLQFKSIRFDASPEKEKIQISVFDTECRSMSFEVEPGLTQEAWKMFIQKLLSIRNTNSKN